MLCSRQYKNEVLQEVSIHASAVWERKGIQKNIGIKHDFLYIKSAGPEEGI